MFVDAEVSSMNTRRRGSSLACSLRHALRAAATSGRSCSAACRLFFKGEIEMIEKPRDRRFTNHHLLPCQPNSQFSQRDVRLLGNPLLDLLLAACQSIALVPAKLLWTHTTNCTPKPDEPPYRTETYLIGFRNLLTRVAVLDRLNYSSPQVFRIGFSHPYWPPAQ